MLNNSNKNFEYQFRNKIFSLIIVTTLLFSFLFFFVIQYSLEKVNEDVNYRFINIESYIDEKFIDTKFKMNHLALSVSKDFIYRDVKFINELFSYLVPKPGYPVATTYGLGGFYNKNMEIVAGTNIDSKEWSKTWDIKVFPDYLMETKKVPFKLQIGKIIYGKFLKELVIPLSISVTNANGEYIGLIWTSLLLKNLNDQLTLHYANNEFLDSIILRNNKNYDTDSDYVFHGLDDNFSARAILKSLVQGDDVIIHKNLKNYPFTVELKVRPEYFKSFLGINILFHIVGLLIGLIVISSAFIIVNNYYRIPLLYLHNRLNFINKASQKADEEPDAFPVIKRFSLNNFTKDITQLLESYYLLKKDAIKQGESEIRKKVLDLALTEKHFLLSEERNASREEELYINKLINLIEEDHVSSSLSDCLDKIIDYCCEFYHEINCEIIVKKKDNKVFSFKHSALNEAIFNIFTFIIRGNFEVYTNPIIIKGSFSEKSSFPFITIEAPISDGQSSTLGWMSGPSYVYSGLLSIHLLAKENNMMLNIKREEDKILFILEPLNKKIEFYNKAFEVQES